LATALHKTTKIERQYRKSYNKQLTNLVEVIPFYGIGLKVSLTGFLHTKFSALCWAVSI